MRFSFFCTTTSEHFALDHDLNPVEMDRMREQIVRIPCPACHRSHAVLVSSGLERLFPPCTIGKAA